MLTERGDVLDFEVEPTEGFHLPSGEAMRGLRVRYRFDGTRRWSSFVVTDDGSQPYRAFMGALLAAIYAHAERKP